MISPCVFGWSCLNRQQSCDLQNFSFFSIFLFFWNIFILYSWLLPFFAILRVGRFDATAFNVLKMKYFPFALCLPFVCPLIARRVVFLHLSLWKQDTSCLPSVLGVLVAFKEKESRRLNNQRLAWSDCMIDFNQLNHFSWLYGWFIIQLQSSIQ